jgi:hypothetical protein
MCSAEAGGFRFGIGTSLFGLMIVAAFAAGRNPAEKFPVLL